MSDAPWYGEGLKFRCQTDCGNCCKGPQPGWAYVTEEEATRIAEFLNMTPDAFGKRHLRLLESGLCLTEKPVTHDCSLWDDERGCTVYKVRPQQCREFPFWPEVVKTEASWNDYANDCPGMNRGTHYDAATIERITQGDRGTRAGPARRLPTV